MKKKIPLTHFIILFLGDADEPEAPLKIVVNRQLRSAVARNRVKRVVREFVRRHRGLLPGAAMVCIARPSAGEVKNHELFRDLESLVAKRPTRRA